MKKIKNILKRHYPLIIVIIVGSMTFYFYTPALVKGFIYLANGCLVNGKIVESKKIDNNWKFEVLTQDCNGKLVSFKDLPSKKEKLVGKVVYLCTTPNGKFLFFGKFRGLFFILNIGLHLYYISLVIFLLRKKN